jgi:hypothetical protein
MRTRIAILLALAASLLLAGGAPEPCPIDGSTSIWTGRTRIDQTTSQMLFQYKCSRLPAHIFWTLN